MLAALVRRLWSRLPRPLRVLAASGAATTTDTTVLLLLCWGAGLDPGVAAVGGCLIGGAVNFAINRRWIFAATDRSWAPQLVRYGVIVVGGGAAVSGLAVAALVAAGLPLLAAKACAIVVALAAWTYPMSARVVFAQPIRRGAVPAAATSAAVTQSPSLS